MSAGGSPDSDRSDKIPKKRHGDPLAEGIRPRGQARSEHAPAQDLQPSFPRLVGILAPSCDFGFYPKAIRKSRSILDLGNTPYRDVLWDGGDHPAQVWRDPQNDPLNRNHQPI
jgi:hypothetical protein